jgi:transposase-like protein
MWLIANAKNGISSYELHRSLGVTQKTGWFMLHRIREAMRSGSIELMGGPVESDESFIGGSKRHKRGPKSHIPKGGSTHKTAVQGIFDRTTGEIRATPVRSTGAKYLHGTIIQNVKPKAVVYTDMAGGYMSLARRGFAHQAVDHLAEYVNGEIHTNNLECFWNLLKRSIKGTYVSVEPFHLHRYLDEHTFRFNLHEGNDSERFLSAVSGTFGRRLTYARLTGKELVQAG